jgi:integrase
MGMGRKRKDNPLGLPERCYWKHGQCWYVHRDGRWEPLGKDVGEAKRKAALYNDPGGTWGTMAWYLDAFVLHCEKRVAQGALAARTYEDYRGDVAYLKAFFGKMAPMSVLPSHIGKYLDFGAENGRAVRANRERSCLSACFTWIIRADPDAGVKINPCRGVRRNTETPRSRYVDDAEYAAVYRIAHRSVRGAMGLVYRTLQRPGDVLKLGRGNIVKKIAGGVEQRILRLKQSKTGRTVEIAVTAEIDAVLADLRGDRKDVASMTLVHTAKGQAYTEDGLAAMLRRYCKKAGVASFGLQDLKAKGATDMYQAGVPLEEIQTLCGHDSVTTTEIYIKRHLTRVVTPNRVSIAGVGSV